MRIHQDFTEKWVETYDQSEQNYSQTKKLELKYQC